ncbi:hypothetical protein OQJ19_02910 [Fluoribacter gormanii]|uniref:Uncharacterized protein n=1 Tax=Fluoribacter gormanii TaxID=464 RepID=A0A377GH04_9GAMM|nr:hypothetical protein [Fluoribacter gormanii]KTD02226.1 hypothetical protein Lgor_1982 [Fluoribacter gormanii]MCW8444414.1 hypothetical protein [Fluoribacter gormanii]MCW8469607.1 hypothetical protein [Fluoribacter gormanii]SIR25566.1 hypothetical protein SAMN05421777_10912 [Fluoribacter gormanii]STO24066.1 Uncharacterised protein [Fluoribacter gormanii]
MLKEFLRKGINFQRVQETLNAGTELVEQAHAEGIHSAPDVEQQMKKKVQDIISEYKEIHKASSLWAVKQTKLMQELRQGMVVEHSQSDEAETAHHLSF